jgi:hypothetical protein
MDTIKEMLKKEFPGRFTVLSEAIHDRLMQLFATYPLPPKDQEELISYIANLPDGEMETALTEFEEAAELEARQNVSFS